LSTATRPERRHRRCPNNGDGEKKKQNGDDGRLLHLSASQFSRVFSFFKPMKRSL
jgi:hypothetical protein